MMEQYQETSRITYGSEGAMFIPVCSKCSRFVKANPEVTFDWRGQPVDMPNAKCSKCGETQMIWDGYL